MQGMAVKQNVAHTDARLVERFSLDLDFSPCRECIFITDTARVLAPFSARRRHFLCRALFPIVHRCISRRSHPNPNSMTSLFVSIFLL